MSIVGTNIKNIRTKKNLSLKEVSKKCGVTELFLSDVESGRRVPNTQFINTVSKVLGVNVEALEPQYFSDYFEEDYKAKDQKPEAPAPRNPAASAPISKSTGEESALSNAFNKATRKIPVLGKITPGKKVPFEMDITDYKIEPVFQGKNNVAGEDFIYYAIPDNSMSGARIQKGDLALVFMTESIFDKDIILFVYNNRAYIRRLKTIEDKKALLYPENPEFETIVADRRDIQIIGKLVRIEFKIS